MELEVDFSLILNEKLLKEQSIDDLNEISISSSRFTAFQNRSDFDDGLRLRCIGIYFSATKNTHYCLLLNGTFLCPVFPKHDRLYVNADVTENIKQTRKFHASLKSKTEVTCDAKPNLDLRVVKHFMTEDREVSRT
ncbi:hypothetical protein J6590_049520 [Homalodisca vitripennis]|nr:hypothetical protein J6590_049520 [Homalodisca vitripennis]